MGACLSKGGETAPAVKASEQNGQAGAAPAPAPAPVPAPVLATPAGRSEDGKANSTIAVSPFAARAQTHGGAVQGNGAEPAAAAAAPVTAAEAPQPFLQPGSPAAGRQTTTSAPTRSIRGKGSVLETLATSSSMGSSLSAARPPLEPPCTTELADGDAYGGPPVLEAAAEKTRVYALKRLGISYTSREPSLDFITRLVTSVCNVQAAVMSFTDARRCYIKSAAGGFEGVESLDRRLAISVWNLTPLNPEVLVVDDLAADNRFKDHPFVRDAPHLRFYASVPLLDASGQRVGALSITDTVARKLDADVASVLCNFAEMLMREVGRVSEAARKSISQGPENEQMLRWIDACSDGVVLLDIRVSRWPILFSNEGWTEVTGLSPVSGSLKCFWDLFQLPGVSASQQPWQLYADAVEQGETFRLDLVLAGSSGKHLYPVVFKPVSEALDDGMVSIKVPAPTRQASANLAAPAQPAPSRLFYFGTISTDEGTRGSVVSARAPSLAPNEDASRPPIVGVKLGPLLGRGSFGSVYYGTWNGAQIAVKVIQHMATEAERVARDEQLEAILGLKMLHPNIVRTFQFATKDRSGSKPATLPERTRVELNGSRNSDVASPSGQRRMMETWIVLELCNRGSLQGAIDKGAFRQRDNDDAPNMVNIMRTATEIAGAMTYLHSLDILHSDLNGNNILLISNTGIDDRPFSVKVSDFGLSRIHIGERTVATQTYGTVTHMPPELLAEGRLSKAADVYAFGVLLWEMYTGQRPWAGLRHVQIITHKMRNGTQLKWPAHVHPSFKDLAQQCMHPNPHQRPTFGEVLELLEPIRDLAERGELRLEAAAPEAEAPPGRQMGALLGAVHQIPEEEEPQSTPPPAGPQP